MFGIRFKTKKTIAQAPTPYATAADFCRIFMKDTNRLYRLALLLTADQAVAEKCFVSGLDTSAKGSPVFKEWAESWARRAIIQNAVQMILPRASEGSSSHGNVDDTAEPPEIAAILELPAFERFVFVMSVLEHYSDQECSLLLSSTRGDVDAARTRALERLGRSAALRRLSFVGSEQKTERAEPGNGLPLAFVRLAPTG